MAAHSVASLSFKVLLHRPGPFEESFGLFLEDGTVLRSAPVSIRGAGKGEKKK